MPIPHWEDDHEIWDTLYLAGVPFPGLAMVKVKGVGQNVDRKKGTGTDGETHTFQGSKAPDIDITVRFWTRKHWIEIQRLLPLIRPVPGKRTPTPLDAQHPTLSLWSVPGITILEFDGPDEDSEKGVKVLHIKAVEFRKPPENKKKSATSTADKSNGNTEYYEKAPHKVKPYNADDGTVTLVRSKPSKTNTAP